MKALDRLALIFLLAFSVCLHTPAQTPLVWDSNFELPRQINGTVYAVAETADAVYYGGSFTRVGSLAASNVVRVDKATGVATPLGTPDQNGTNGIVRAMTVIGTDLFVGGDFTSVRNPASFNISANRIAKWSTTTSQWSPLGFRNTNGTNGTVYALAVSGTDLFVGGFYTLVSDANMANRSARNIAKWSTTTSQWAPLGGTASNNNGTDRTVFALALSGTDLFVGGKLSSVSDANTANRSARHIAKWSTTTNEWSPLGSPTLNGTNSFVTALAVSGADLFVGGAFNTVSDDITANRSANYIAKWSTATSQWAHLGTTSGTDNGTNNIVYALAVSGTDLFVGGYFTSVSNATTANRIAKWSTTTSQWSSLGSPTQNGTNNTTYALAVSGSDLFVGGDFGSVSDSSQANNQLRYAAKWNITNSQWERVISDDEIRIGIDSGFVRAVLDAGPVIYVGGSFTRVGNVEARNVACLTKATGLWSPLGNLTQNGTSGEVSALALSGTDLFVGGGFTSVSDATTANRSASNIAKWSTTTSQWAPLRTTSATNNGTNGRVSALAVSGTDLFVGGFFTLVSDANMANRIAKWSTTTSQWAPLGTTSPTNNGTNGGVSALAVSGTDLFVGGSFNAVADTSSSSISANNIAKWSMTTNQWSSLGTPTQNGTNNAVQSLAVSGTDLFVGGFFVRVSDAATANRSANFIAQWNTTTSQWSHLGTPTENGTNSSVSTLVISGTDLFVGGGFTTVSDANTSNLSANRIAQWNRTTSQWSPLGSTTQNGTNSHVNALARVVKGNEVYLVAGGSFTTVSSSTQNSIPSHLIASAFLNTETAGKPYHDEALVLRNYYTSIGKADLSLAWFYYYTSLGFYFDFLEAGDSPSAALYYYLYGSYFYYHYYVDAGYPATALYILYHWQGLAYASYYQGLGYNDAATYYYTLYLGYANSAYAYYTSLGSR